MASLLIEWNTTRLFLVSIELLHRESSPKEDTKTSLIILSFKNEEKHQLTAESCLVIRYFVSSCFDYIAIFVSHK